MDSRDKSGSSPAPVLSSRRTIVLQGEEQERAQKLQKAAEARTGQAFRPGCGPLVKLYELAGRLTDRQADVLVRELDHEPGHLYIPKVVDVMADLAAERAVKMAGRPDEGSGGGHFHEFDAIEA